VCLAYIWDAEELKKVWRDYTGELLPSSTVAVMAGSVAGLAVCWRAESCCLAPVPTACPPMPASARCLGAHNFCLQSFPLCATHGRVRYPAGCTSTSWA
jgi:hypothetical protein